ncbi:MAG: flagellar FlbD family protein [Vulcanimicrobiaceae bacterium]
MISLQRPNGHPVIVNVDLIETIERVDEQSTTLVTLVTGNVVVVVDDPAQIREAVIEFKRRIAAHDPSVEHS